MTSPQPMRECVQARPAEPGKGQADTVRAEARSFLAIDPGHEQSAYVQYDPQTRLLLSFEKLPNDELLDAIETWSVCPAQLVIEQVACMGMAVGAEVFETVFWSGQFWQAFRERSNNVNNRFRVKRHEVKQHLCGNQRAKDPNIRQALIDRYGGKEKAIGKKAAPGPLYGVSKDVWAALAVAVTWADRFFGLPAAAKGAER